MICQLPLLNATVRMTMSIPQKLIKLIMANVLSVVCVLVADHAATGMHVRVNVNGRDAVPLGDASVKFVRCHRATVTR